MSIKSKEFIIFVGGTLIIMAVYTFDGIRDHVESSKQEAMRESWTEGYEQGYSDAYFKLTGDEE